MMSTVNPRAAALAGEAGRPGCSQPGLSAEGEPALPVARSTTELARTERAKRVSEGDIG
jgi:hypothetical protein